MEPKKDSYDPQESYFNASDESVRSDDIEDDIVYIENGNCAADTLRWTTTSNSRVLRDEHTTQHTAGSQSQLSQSRGEQNALPSLITRRERRLLRRKTVERQKTVDCDAGDGNHSESDDEPARNGIDVIGEKGDEVFASIQDLIDGREMRDIAPNGLISRNKDEQFPDGLDEAHEIRSIDDKGANCRPNDNVDDSKRSQSQSNEVRSDDDNSDSFGEEILGKCVVGSYSSQEVLVRNERVHDDRIIVRNTDKAGETVKVPQHPSTEEITSWPKYSEPCDRHICEPESSSAEEHEHQGEEFTLKDCMPGCANQAKLIEVRSPLLSPREDVFSPMRGDDDSESMGRIMRFSKRHQGSNMKKKEKDVACSNNADEFWENQGGLLVAARNHHRRRQKKPLGEKSKRDKVMSQFPFSQSNSSGKRSSRDEQAQTSNTNSIVGSRPCHWSRNLSPGRKPLRNSESTIARAVALSKATRLRKPPSPSRLEALSSKPRKRGHGNFGSIVQIPTEKKIHQPGSSSKSKSKSENSSSSVNKVSQTSVTSTSIQRASHVSGWNQNADIRSAEFAPSFLTNRPKEVEGGAVAIEDSEFPASDIATSPFSLHATNLGSRHPFSQSEAATSAQFSKYNSRSSRSTSGRKRKRSGLLMTKLRSIRCAIDGDNVRFQSGAYPFQLSQRNIDISDPRSRAESFADITIVGDPLPWSSGGQRVTVLGYVHFASSKKSPAHKLSSSLPNPAQPPADSNVYNGQSFHSSAGGMIKRENLLPKFPCFLWVSFTFDTTHLKKIGQGVHLRIYNAIVIHSKSAEQSLPTMLCTQICELYPKALPSLPVTPEFIS